MASRVCLARCDKGVLDDMFVCGKVRRFKLESSQLSRNRLHCLFWIYGVSNVIQEVR